MMMMMSRVLPRRSSDQGRSPSRRTATMRSRDAGRAAARLRASRVPTEGGGDARATAHGASAVHAAVRSSRPARGPAAPRGPRNAAATRLPSHARTSLRSVVPRAVAVPVALKLRPTQGPPSARHTSGHGDVHGPAGGVCSTRDRRRGCPRGPRPGHDEAKRARAFGTAQRLGVGLPAVKA
jgi:hypothetical protein